MLICMLGLLYLLCSSASLAVCNTPFSDFSNDGVSLVLLGVLLNFCIHTVTVSQDKYCRKHEDHRYDVSQSVMSLGLFITGWHRRAVHENEISWEDKLASMRIDRCQRILEVF